MGSFGSISACLTADWRLLSFTSITHQQSYKQCNYLADAQIHAWLR